MANFDWEKLDEDLGLKKSTINWDSLDEDLGLIKIPTAVESKAGLVMDPRLEGVKSSRQEDVQRLYNVFENNPEVVEQFKIELSEKKNPVIDYKFMKSLYGPNWYENKSLQKDLGRFKFLTGMGMAGANPEVIGHYPPASLDKKLFRDDLYDVSYMKKPLSETENVPWYLEKPMALGAGLEKGVKGAGLLITEMADLAVGTELTDWLDDNWDTIDTGGGVNKFLDVIGQFGLGYGASLKLLQGIRRFKALKRGQGFGVSPSKTSKIAGRMGYYTLPALMGDAVVMNLEDQQLGEVMDLYSFGDPDIENLTPREKAWERLKRKFAFGLEGAALTGGIIGGAKPIMKLTGKIMTGKPLKNEAYLPSFVRDASIMGTTMKGLGLAMDMAAVPVRFVGGPIAAGTRKAIQASGLPPFKYWRFFDTTASDWKQRWLKKTDNMFAYFRTSKDLFREVFDIERMAEGEIKAIRKQFDRTFSDVDKSLHSLLKKQMESSSNSSPLAYEQVVDDFVEYLKGAVGGKGMKGLLYDQLDPSIRVEASQAYIALKALMKEANRLSPKQADYEMLLKNIKQHFNISYRAFNNARYKPTKELREEFMKWALPLFRQQFKAQGETVTETQLRDRTEASLNQLLASAGTAKGSPLDIITQIQKHLPEEFPVAKPGELLPDVVKRLLGGPKDSRTMFLDVITDLSESVWRTNLHNTMYRTGKGEWIFDNPNALVDKGYKNKYLEEITSADFAKAGHRHTPFKLSENLMVSSKDGSRRVFVTPEMKKALLDSTLVTDRLLQLPIYRSFLALKAGSQYSKTVLSLMTQVRNVTSAFMFPLANGHVGGGGSYVDAYRQILRDVFGRTGGIDKRALDDFGAELERANILSSSVIIRDMEDMFKAIMERNIKGVKVESGGLGQVGNWKLIDDDAFINFLTKNPAMKKLTELYQAGDIIHKIYGYSVTKSQYKTIFNSLDDVDNFHKEILGKVFDRKKLNGELKTLDDAIEETAGKTVNNTYPNYNYIPTIVKELRRMPFGNFISFASEMYRTTGNIANYAFKELSSSNPYIRQMGAKRVVGLTSTFAIPVVSVNVAMNALGMNEEQMDALRRNNTAPWNRYANLLPYSYKKKKDGNVEVKYINISYSNPYDILQKPVTAMFNSIHKSSIEKQGVLRTTRNAVMESLNEILSPFISDAIIGQAIKEAIRGKTDRGSRIWNDYYDGPFEAGQKALYHVLKALTPTTFVNLSRLEQGLVRQDDDTNHRGYDKNYKPVNLAEELIALFAGVRLSESDAFENMQYTVLDFNKKMDEIRSASRGDQYRNFGYDDKLKAFIDGQTGRYLAFNEMRLALDDAITLGADERKLIKKELEGRLTKKEIQALKNNEYLPLPPLKRNGEAVGDSIEEIVGATVNNTYPIREQKDVERALRRVPLFLTKQEFMNYIREALGLATIKTEPESDDTWKNLDKELNISQAYPSINMITRPRTQAATPQVATSAVTGTDQGLTPTEKALLSPEEQLIKLRQKGISA